MDQLKKIFPLSYPMKSAKSLLTAIILYLAIDVACALIFGLLRGIPVVGGLFNILGWLVAIYSLLGIILAAFSFYGTSGR